MPANDPQTILILGGGVGGIATASRLGRRIDRRHRVVLVNRDRNFSSPPPICG